MEFYRNLLIVLTILLATLLVGCDDSSWNSPYPNEDAKKNIRYSSFSESPKTLDPARSYSSNEIQFTGQIYEPPLQYHYLKRPYTLIPLTAKQMPIVTYLNGAMQKLADDTPDDQIAFTRYDIDILPGIKYQPHPAFAKNSEGNFYYHNLSLDDIEDIYSIQDFKHSDTRELLAEDYVYQIKRLAHPELNSPIFGLMQNYIVGLDEYATTLQNHYDTKQQAKEDFFLDLRLYPLKGVKVEGPYHYSVLIKGKYPQFLYWLAMPFFAPIPWEADYFYSQPDMDESNLSFDWYPIGTGPYMLTENNPNQAMILERNPYFRLETYPTEGEAEDTEQLKDAGKQLPFIDKVIFSLEKESIPRWSKFLQGYYDHSSISSDSFDQAIQIDQNGEAQLTADMRDKDIRLQTSVNPSIFYMGFNMLDDTVGGYDEKAKKLRRAISIALNYEEYISIFLNGRGIPAQGPIPPGIFGYRSGEKGINPYVYEWNNNETERKPIDEAKKLLAEAGYPDGRDANTGEPLILNYDVASSSGPDDKARFDWMRKQFAKLGIQLNIRATQYNRFQEKMRTGNAQLFSWGWLADYPDPENFLFLLYGPNAKVTFSGENAANYQNTAFDLLFNKMKNMPNGVERQQVIDQMLNIVRADSPWIWGVHPKDFILSHSWNAEAKPNAMANNALKYQRLDPEVRAQKRKIWNQYVLWPIVVIICILLLTTIPVIIIYWRKEHTPKYH